MIARTPRRIPSALAAMAVLVAALAAPSAAYAVRTLGLSSGTFKFEVPASGELQGKVIVSNDGDEDLKVMVYASDQTVDEQGNITYIAPTRADLASLDNPSTWVRVSMPANSKSIGNIPYLEIAPGKKVPVKFSLAVPPGTTPGDHNVLVFFESFDLPKPGQTVQSVVSGRLGTRITLRVPGDLFKKLEVRPFNVPAWVIGAAVPYDFTVRNEGNVDQRIGGRALLLDRNGNEIASQNPINGRMSFAGSSMVASETLLAQGLAIGPYKVRLDVTEVDDDGKAVAGGKDTITEVKTVWLLPLWMIITVAALIVLLLVRVIWSAAVRSTRRKHEKDEANRIRAAELEAEQE